MELHDDASDAAELFEGTFSCCFNSFEIFLGINIFATGSRFAADGDGGLCIDAVYGIGETAGVEDRPVDGVEGGIGGDMRLGCELEEDPLTSGFLL